MTLERQSNWRYNHGFKRLAWNLLLNKTFWSLHFIFYIVP